MTIVTGLERVLFELSWMIGCGGRKTRLGEKKLATRIMVSE